MQSPEISTFIADTVTYYLQDYIIKFRTEKARKDLYFTEQLFDEAKANYYTAQQNYATFVDENLSIISARFRTKQERLQKEMTLAYTVYDQTAQQLQLAKVKVQDDTPVYTVIQPAVVPLKPSKPPKLIILISFVFLAAIISGSWIVFKKFLLNK
jgi:nucleosome binding factor SPN SPT16 subunit